ncbi:TPA: YPDG domain-containing protein, partial [Streptococcus suis]
MSNKNKNMFRQEQRFSFRKYSFGLASALIANVVFGATIAGGPVVHADTETEVAAVTSSSSQQSEVESIDAGTSISTETVAAPVERQVALTYTVKVVDKAGTVLKTEVKTVDVTAGESLAFIIAELGEDLVPVDYKLVDGLGQVRVVENQENVFTVTVEKEVAETSPETQATEVSETETATASSEEVAEVVVASETAVAPAPVKVIETPATNTSGLSSLALLAYEVHYTDSEGQVVGKTAGLVTAESKDGVATKEVSFTASDLPEGYKLAEGQSASLTKQLLENQVNILSFSVVKKSEEEEIAASQLANKDVLEQVTSEADLLADEALRQVATTQAGNTALEAAAITTKETAKEAQAILNDVEATQEVVDATVETVKAASKALADEMLKVDADGNITAQLSYASSNGVFSNAKNNTYIVADSPNLNTATQHLRVSQEVTGDIQTGQTSTWTVIYNEGDPNTGYGHQLTRGAHHRFAIGNDVNGNINIQAYRRSDVNGAWILIDSTTQNNWPGSYYTHKGLSNDLKEIIDQNIPNRRELNTLRNELATLHNIGNTNQPELYHNFDRNFGHTTNSFKVVITAKIRAGRDARNVAFMAANDPGSTRNRYYSLTPAKVDPVTISDIAGGQSSVTLTPQELAERIEVKVKNQNVVLERQANGTYNATTNAANVTVSTNTATGAYTPTITLTLPTGTTFAEGDKVRAQSSIADASQVNSSGLNRSGSEYEQLISSDQGRQYSVITEKTAAAEKTDQYNITWDNQSVPGRTDTGFEWATDASGNRVLVYKYNLDNHTAFSMDDILKQLNATPKDSNAGLRTLDGTEKALIENNDATDRYTLVNNTAKLDGQTIDFLDVVNPKPLWGGRKVVSSDPGNRADYNTFYVPGTTDIGTASRQITIEPKNGVDSITLTSRAQHMYSNQIDRQKLYIRSSPASVENGSSSAVGQDTDTDTIPVYMVGYKEATDQYNITWDNKSVAGRTDAGFEWATDTSGNRVLVYKYDLDNHTAFTMDDVLKQLNATPKDSSSGLRTLDGPEKSKIEHNQDGYSREGKIAKLNGQTIDFLDVVNPNPLWGGRKVVSSDPGTNANYNTFYVPGTTDIGTASNQITIGNTNGVGSITLTDSAHNMYSNQIDRQKLYIRTTEASTETGSGSAVATDTDTDTIPVYMVGYKRNNPPVITTSATNTNVTVQEGTPKAIHIFSKTVGDTEDASGNKLFTPDANKNLANPLVPIRKLAEFSDPDAGDTVTYKYNDLRNDQTNLSQTNLVMTNDGYLSGHYTDWGPGAKSTRRIDVTDNHGAMTSSDPFLVLGYTVKADNTTPLAVTGRPTLDQIKTKLVTDVNSAYPNAVPSTMVVPTDQYAHAIVGYRTAAGQPTQTGELPASGNYQVRVRTTNIYGQELFNWVDVNSTPANTPATGTDKQPLYIFTNTAIKTVDAGTNVDSSTADDKVKVATLQDPEGIKSVVISRESDTSAGSFSPAPIGITIDTQGNASGTTDKGVGVYSRGLTVTDNNDVVTNLFPRNNEIETYVFDATAGATITKAIGETVTEAEILNNVTVATGNGNTLDSAIDTRYRKVLAPNQTVPSTPGTHTVTVRVITASNVYKDVPVTVVIPENPASTATNKQDIYVFKNSPIQTVNPATNVADNANKVKIADLADPQGIKRVEVKQIGSALGYTVDTEGNATGTVADVGVGAYSREMAVTDNLDAQTTVLVNGNPDQRFKTYVMDVTADTTPVAFSLGDTLESRTADILSKVSISSGAESAHIEGTTDNNPKYTKVIAPGETLPTTPGDHTITVRVITESNVYKDVEVPITIPANTAPTVRQDIPNQYVWKGTSLTPAVDADVNDVNSTATRDDIQRVYFSFTQNTNDAGNPGAVSITKDDNGNYLIGGTPVGGAGESWTRRVTAQDKQNATGQSNPFTINILDSRVVSEITKPENSPVTADEVLAQVEVISRSVSGGTTHDVTTRLNNDGGVTKRVLTDLSAMPKTGRQTVQVELTTPSGHKKIEEVIVNFASPETDNATPAYAEKTVVPGTPATSTPTFTDANGQPITTPAGARYEIPADFQAPAGYTAEIDPNTGVVTVTAADGTTVESIEVPVKVTYTDGSTDNTTAVFKLDTDGDSTPDITDTDDDNDNIPDVEENTDNTNPKNPDTDGDGITDGAEKTNGTDPKNPDTTAPASPEVTPNEGGSVTVTPP